MTTMLDAAFCFVENHERQTPISSQLQTLDLEKHMQALKKLHALPGRLRKQWKKVIDNAISTSEQLASALCAWVDFSNEQGKYEKPALPPTNQDDSSRSYYAALRNCINKGVLLRLGYIFTKIPTNVTSTIQNLLFEVRTPASFEEPWLGDDDYSTLCGIVRLPLSTIWSSMIPHQSSIEASILKCGVTDLNAGELQEMPLDIDDQNAVRLVVGPAWEGGTEFYASVECQSPNMPWKKPMRFLIAEQGCTERECEECNYRDPHLSPCGGCRKVYYCDKTCQKQNWKEYHKLLCKLPGDITTAESSKTVTVITVDNLMNVPELAEAVQQILGYRPESHEETHPPTLNL
ncbi:hypothetical protein HDV00_003167 [Rhizophlyctis rosea]|nr:hypothetical protein HDV00_003167 [Rhizophlyctis rosea]